MGDFPELPTLVDAAPLERKPLQVIVISVMVVMSVTFPHTYGDFLHDGELVVCSGSVIAASLREWLIYAVYLPV
jgi:hypothetical protein